MIRKTIYYSAITALFISNSIIYAQSFHVATESSFGEKSIPIAPTMNHIPSMSSKNNYDESLVATGDDKALKEHQECDISNCWRDGTIRFRTSLYTHHWSYNPEHNDQQHYLGFDYIRKDNWLVGFGYFRNSFDQPTQYLYFGKEWRLWQPTEDISIRGMLTGGLMHGYKGEYKNKIPLNNLGTAPAVLPTLAIDYKFFTLEAHLLGNSGVMATAGFTLSLDH